MTERAESVGGTLTVAGRADGGVVVEARLPHLLGHPDESGLADPRVFLEQVMETISDCYTAIDSEWRYVYMNRAGYRLLHRDPADSVVGGLIWDEFEIAPEFEAAYRRARDEHVEVEITGYHAAWDTWIYNRIVPTAGGLSIVARDVSDEMRKAATARRQERETRTLRALSRAIAASGRDDDADVLTRAAVAVVETWPVRGLRVTWPGGSVAAGDLVGPVRRVPLRVEGTEVGVAELAGETDDEVDSDVLELLALRVSAAASGS